MHPAVTARYPADLVTAIEGLSCLRCTGMPVQDMRTYIATMNRGRRGAADQHELFARHAERLRAEIARLRLRERYVSAKAELWAARVSGDAAAEERITPTAIELGAALLKEEVELHHD